MSGKRSTDDDAHRIVEIRPSHLVFDVDRNEVFIAVAVVGYSGTSAGRVEQAGFRCCRSLPRITPKLCAECFYYSTKAAPSKRAKCW